MLMYGIVSSETSVPQDVCGLDGRPLRTISVGPLAALIGAEPAPAPDRERLVRYEEIIERVMRRETILPARFGSVAEDEDAIGELLSRRATELSSDLARVAGAVEMGVRVAWTGLAPRSDDASGDQRPGTRYLNSLAERAAEGHRIAEAVAERVAGLVRGQVLRVAPRSDTALNAAYLIPDSSVDDFLQRCEDLSDELEGVELICSGPWPPYSFVTEVKR